LLLIFKFMIRTSSVRYYLFILILIAPWSMGAQITEFKKIHWDREKIVPGLKWLTAHTLLNDSIPQNINVLIINSHKRIVSLVYNPSINTLTSIQAKKEDGIAAVNAGFFNIREGGSASYIRTGALILDADTAKKWKQNANMTGSVLIDKKNQLTIVKAMSNLWYDSHQEYKDVLVTGPLLLSANVKSMLPGPSNIQNIHPRTAIGKRGNHKIIIVTIDGRTDQARGMTLTELTDLMLSLNCRDAVNLDGGGSTTMWIAGKHFNGIVNMPSDNKKFDHEGERAVSDILIIK